MKISVIIPFRNAEAYLGRCIESCKRATGDFEFILVDDNQCEEPPKDTMLAVKTANEDNRFKFTYTSPWEGVSIARNAGIDIARGEWLTFLDADDELLRVAHHQMERAITTAGLNPIVQLNHLRYYAEINKLACKYKNQQGIYTLQNLPECWCMVWNKLIKTEWLKENRIRFKQGLQYGEDELFNLEMLREHPFIACAEAHRIAVKRNFDNKHSLSRSKGTEELFDQIDALEEFLLTLREDEKSMREFVMNLIAEHWQSPTYKRIIGGIEDA